MNNLEPTLEQRLEIQKYFVKKYKLGFISYTRAHIKYFICKIFH